MKQKNTMEILNEIRNKRNSELENQKRTDISVVKVELLGKGEKSNEELYRLIEIQEFGDKPSIRFEKFYTYDDEPKLIAVKNPETGEILPVGMDGNENDKWDIYKEDIQKNLEERERELKAIAKELGLDEEEINSLSEIDLAQIIEDKELEKEEENEQQDDEAQVISEENAEKLGIKGNGMNSAKLDVQIDTKGNTLGKELNLEEYESILVVHSYKLAELNDSKGESGKTNNMRFGLVGKKKDGTLETIPESKLRPYRGANRQVTQINDREEVEVKNEDCIFEVPNSHKRIAINQKDPYGIPEIYYGKSDKENSGNIMQSVQDERDGTQKKDVEVRALFNANKGEYQIDKMQDEVEGHIKNGCDDLDKDEIDGDKNTGHQHNYDDIVITPDTLLIYEGKEMTIREIASEPRFKLSADEFIKKFKEKTNGNKNIEQDEVYDEIEEEVNNEIRNKE